jgi:6-phosphogluconolactonase
MAQQHINTEVKVFTHLRELFNAAALDFVRKSLYAVENKGVFTVGLSGGSTPIDFFVALTNMEVYSGQIPWQKIKFFFVDERFVPSNSTNSNYNTAYTYLFSKLPILKENIYRVRTELNSLEEVSQNYEIILKEAFGCEKNNIPQFDLIYLGIGADAHTASLMPQSNIVLDYSNQIEKPALVAHVHECSIPRITLTPKLINHSKNIVFLVTGANKAPAVKHILTGEYKPWMYPGQLIHAKHGQTSWYLDQEAYSAS